MCLNILAIGVIGTIYGGVLGGILAPGPSEHSSHDTAIELGLTVGGLDMDRLHGQGFCGYGVKLGYPWKDHALFEAEYALHVDRFEEHTHSLFLAGLRVGIRKRKVGAFLGLQPGVIRFVETSYTHPPPYTRLALSAGGVVEVHLGPRLYIRSDQGYLIIWFGDATFPGVQSERPGTSKYYHGSFGIGVRF